MDNLKEFWEKVPTKWRHFTTGKNTLTQEKSKRIIDRVTKNLFNHINFSEVNNALDWGCGGGLLSKELSKKCLIHMVDISPNSLKNAKTFLGDSVYGESILLPNKLEEFKYDGEKIDLIFSNEVIQHFPTLSYFENVLTVWKEINPTYIAVQIKLDKKTKQTKNYENNFLNGLRFNEKDFINYFLDLGYKNTHTGYEWTKQKDCQLGYYVFIKK